MIELLIIGLTRFNTKFLKPLFSLIKKSMQILLNCYIVKLLTLKQFNNLAI